MTDQALEKLTRQIMLDAVRLEYGSLLEGAPEHTFSPAFERKMKKLLRRGRHPVLYRTLRAVACLLLVLLLSGCAVLAISPAAREVFAGWVREIHDNYFLYEFWGNEEREPVSKEEVLYQPSYVPTGYRMEYRSMLSGITAIGYINDQSGNLAFFHCFTDLTSPVMQIERDSGDAYKKITVNGISADLYLDAEEGESNILVWVDEVNRRAFSISGAFGEEELLRMAESVGALPRNVIFRPSWLPEGYYETSAKDCPVKGDKVPEGLDVGKSVLTYEDGKGGRLTITYAQEFDVTGLSPDRCEASVLVWAQDGLLFSIQGYCTNEELIAMAESVEILPVEYRPTWVPEGYELYLQNDTFGNSFSFLYKNPEGRLLHFMVQLDREGARSYLFPNENAEEKQVLVGRNPADMYLVDTGGANSELVWQDPEAGALFYISAFLPEEDILKMAESIEGAAPSPKVRQPNWLPMGYRYTGGSAGSSSKERQYEDENGDEIQFAFLGPPETEEKEKLQETVKGLESQSVLVDGQAAELYSAADGIRYLVWDGQEAGELYWLAAALDSEALVQIAESVRLSEKS